MLLEVPHTNTDAQALRHANVYDGCEDYVNPTPKRLSLSGLLGPELSGFFFFFFKLENTFV